MLNKDLERRLHRSICTMVIVCSLPGVHPMSTAASAAVHDAVVPEFSQSSGYIAENSTISLSAPEDYTIYYTVDCSKPTADSEKYTDEIVLRPQPSVLAAKEDKWAVKPDSYKTDSTLPSAEVIRAVAVAPDGTAGEIVTNTYFFDKLPSIPVISLVMEYDDLLDYDSGIIAKGAVYDEWAVTESGRALMDADLSWEYEGNYSQHGREWERPVHLQIFEDGELTESDAGIRLHGGASRRAAQKGFNIYFREDYGEKTLDYVLFPGYTDPEGNTISEFKSFVIRNGGNDWCYLKFRDEFFLKMAESLDVVTQASRAVMVYLNGEYYGIETLQERYSDKDLADRYNVSKENVIVVKEGELEEGEDEDLALYNDLLDYAEKDMSDPAAYSELESVVDTQSMADYFAYEIYIGNADWTGMDKNTELWRVREPENEQDGRWRFILYDTEYSAGLYGEETTSAQHNHLADALDCFPLFRAAMQNETFRSMFAESMERVADIFRSDNYMPVLSDCVSVYKPYMPDFFKRYEGSMERWEDNYAMLNSYFASRYENIMPVVKAY